MTYCTDCPRRCKTFREHVGNGPFISGAATPSRSNVSRYAKTEAQWQADEAAYRRLAKDGHELSIADGAAEIEKRATQPIELEHGKVYGEQRAAKMQRVANGEFND